VIGGGSIMASRRMMTLQELTDYLHVSRSTIYRLLRRNQLAGLRIGSHWRFNVEEIELLYSSQSLSRGPIALVVLVVMAALAVDIGNLWTIRRLMQSAADASAGTFARRAAAQAGLVELQHPFARSCCLLR
jgi:excisionase family DNA binding protein